MPRNVITRLSLAGNNAIYAPVTNNVNRSSLKVGYSTIGPDRGGGIRCLRKAIATIFMAGITKLIIRTVQGNPILYKSYCTIARKISPPVALPQAPMPIASDRLVVKYVGRSEGWAEEQPVANSCTQSLGEKELPVPTMINGEPIMDTA